MEKENSEEKEEEEKETGKRQRVHAALTAYSCPLKNINKEVTFKSVK